AWTGIVSQLELMRSETGPLRTNAAGVSTYAVTIVPRLWLLSQWRNYRIFQYLSEVDIALKLLKEWNIDHVVRLERSDYRKRKYKVQYGESDYAFFARL